MLSGLFFRFLTFFFFEAEKQWATDGSLAPSFGEVTDYVHLNLLLDGKITIIVPFFFLRETDNVTFKKENCSDRTKGHYGIRFLKNT